MRVLLYVFAIVILLGSAPATAQMGTVVEHYRSYREALARGDLAGAETAAAAALAASEARDGEGGRTAVLLLNLAQTRLEAGRPADALAPAQRALTIAEARGAESGVDPVLARLVLGQAELTQPGDAGLRRLPPAIDEALAGGALQWEAYAAAKALAEWAMRENRLTDARDAWTSAIAAATGDDPLAVTARATAYVGRGAAFTLMDEPGRADHPPIGSHIRDTPDGRAYADFAEALRHIFPVARIAVERAALTEAQLVYAQALAWTHALRARLITLGWEPPSDGDHYLGLRFDLNREDGVPVCSVRIDPDPMPRYPREVQRRYGVGAVVVRIVTNGNGDITDIRPLATVGGATLTRSVTEVADQWRLIPTDNYREPCTKETVRFAHIMFRLE